METKGKKKGRYLAWKAWDNLCHPKSVRGLGFKKAKEVNSTLLAKLAWMVCSGKRSICMDILHAKYKVGNDWLQADPPKQIRLRGEQLNAQKTCRKRSMLSTW